MNSRQNLLTQAFRLATYYRIRIALVTAALVAITVVMSVLWLNVMPFFVATAKVTMLPSRQEISYTSRRSDFSGSNPAMVLSQTHTEFLLSRTIAEDVVATIWKEVDPAQKKINVVGRIYQATLKPLLDLALRTRTMLNYGVWSPIDPKEKAVLDLQKRTSVENVPGSYILAVSVMWDDPHVAARAANLLTERYVDLTLKANQEEMRVARAYIEERIGQCRKDLQAVDERIKTYKESEKLYAVATDISLKLEELSKYVQDFTSAQVSLEELDTRIASLKSFQTPAGLAEFQAEREGLAAKKQALEKVIDERMKKLDAYPGQEYELLDLFRDKMDQQKTLAALHDRLLNVRISEAAQLSAVKVIDPAVAPPYPDAPKVLDNGLASILVGLILSTGLVMATEYRRRSIRSAADLDGSREALVGVVPFHPAAVDADLREVHADRAREDGEDEEGGRGDRDGGGAPSDGAFARHLEHLLVQIAEGSRGKVVMLTIPAGREGKTFLAERLARMAGQAGRKVLLVDGNMARPHLHRAFGKSMTVGLSDALLSGAPLAHAVTRAEERVDLIPAGTAPYRPRSPWAVDAVRSALVELTAGYDLVLMDAASLRADPAAARLWALADRVVGVFDATATVERDLEEFNRRTAGAVPVSGVILNKVKYRGDFLFGH